MADGKIDRVSPVYEVEFDSAKPALRMYVPGQVMDGMIVQEDAELRGALGWGLVARQTDPEDSTEMVVFSRNLDTGFDGDPVDYFTEVREVGLRAAEAVELCLSENDVAALKDPGNHNGYFRLICDVNPDIKDAFRPDRISRYTNPDNRTEPHIKLQWNDLRGPRGHLRVKAKDPEELRALFEEALNRVLGEF